MTDKIDDKKAVEPRREFMQKAALAIGTGVAGMSVGQALAMGKKGSKSSIAAPDFSTLDYRNNYWARDALARLQGDLDFGKQKFGWYKGSVRSIVPNKKNQVLFWF